IQSYYSYAEGVWAEEHLRANRAAEEATIQAGNLLAMARLAGVPLDRQEELNDLWRTVLKYQDHDVTWIELTDLRRKAIGQFQHVVAEDRKLMGDVAATLVHPDTNSLAVFNGLARPRAALLEVGADEAPGGAAKLQKVGEKFVGFVDLPACGYRSFSHAKDSGREPKEVPMPEHLDTEFYRVQLSKEGLIETLATANGRKLVTGDEYLGGEIRAVIGDHWVNNRSATCKFYDGDVCGVLERTGTFGHPPSGAQPAPEAAWIREGKSGGALKLSGSSYVAAGGLGSFDQLTVAMWVKPTALDYNLQALLHCDGWDTSALHFILLKDGRVQVAVKGAAVKGAEPVDLYSVATPGRQLGEWTHLALVYDAPAKRLSLFVNGRKDAGRALTQTMPVVLDKFRLGAWDKELRFFHGMLDDVRIYRGALDEATIAGIAGGANPPRAKLAARWAMDQTNGTQIADASGGKHPATLVQAERGAIMGHGIPLRERYIFFKHQPVIKAELEFDFDGDEIGDFHLEETKLNVYYPTPGGEIWHDVPFGFEPASEGDQLLSLNWVQCGGLTYVNRGTPKHWVRNGVIANTLAWGGNRWSNRIHYDYWKNRCPNYDLRLHGRQKIEYFLIPSDSLNRAAVTRDVEALTAPVFIAQGAGEKSWCSVKGDTLAVTALFEKDGQVWTRGYQMPSAKKGRFRDWEIFNLPVREILQKGVAQ
ncbi:MAG: LamG domain-containing protein, partial [Verrucomicrobiota bacterium]